MHETNDLLRNLALVLTVAAVTTVIFQRLRQPVVFGYILAGLIIGPHLPIPLVADRATVETLSELGVIMLMFSLGLEFSLRRLMRAGGWSVVIVGVLQSSLLLWLGNEAARLFGWPLLASLFAGAAIATSSTTIIAKAFVDERARGRYTELVIGILVVEDLVAIVLIALLTPASAGTTAAASSIALTILRLVGLLTGFLALGTLLVPRLIRFVVSLKRSEITLIVSIGICFATALLARTVGYSVALGAFLAASLVAESGEEELIAHLIEPVRDMFAAVFFVSVGMQIVPGHLLEHWGAVLVFTLLVLVGKTLIVSIATFFTGAGTPTSVKTGMSLAQIGEFSFIIAGVGVSSGAAPASLYSSMVAVSAITTLTTPWMIRFANPVAEWVDRNLPRPLQTFTALYGAWIESLRARPETSADKLRLRRALRGLIIDACVITALSIGASLAAVPAGERLAGRTGLTAFQAQALIVGVAVLLSVPFLVGILRTGRVVGQLLSRRAFPDPEPNRLDLAAAPRRALVVAIQLGTVMVVGAPLVAITQPFVPAFAGFGVLLACLLVLGVVVWRTAADLHGHVRAAAEAIVDALGRQGRQVDPREGERALQRAYQLLPGLGEPVPVRIEESSPVAGLALSDLGLRGRTGATIIAISRGKDVVLVPDGHETLRAGDVVALAGTRPAIEAARQLLLYGKET
jgi:CPA2 family monovalent cation:H+ antiporter-2